jgi:hypothetical protein
VPTLNKERAATVRKLNNIFVLPGISQRLSAIALDEIMYRLLRAAAYRAMKR